MRPGRMSGSACTAPGTGPEEINGKDGKCQMAMGKDLKEQIFEMCIGVVAYELILCVICLIFFREWNVFLGILVGTLGAMAFIVNIGQSVEQCVDSEDPDYAKKSMRAHSVRRQMTVLIVTVLAAKFTDMNLVAAMAALLGIKPGAYLYPIVHKLRNRK